MTSRVITVLLSLSAMLSSHPIAPGGSRKATESRVIIFEGFKNEKDRSMEWWCVEREIISDECCLSGIISHHITSLHITSHHITSHHIREDHITSEKIRSDKVTSHHYISHHITSEKIRSDKVTSYHTTSHHIREDQIRSHPSEKIRSHKVTRTYPAYAS
jgi:hypothetical protein